jgi:hypothetical protein
MNRRDFLFHFFIVWKWKDGSNLSWKERFQEIKGRCKHPLSIFPPNNLSFSKKG